MTALLLIILGGALSIAYGLWAINDVMKRDAGTQRMQEIAGAIAEGAQAYLRRQYMTIGIVGIILFVPLAYFLGASIAVGFAVGRLLGEVQPQWLVQVIGVVLILIGSTIHAIGFWSYRRTFQKLEQAGTRGIPMWLIGTITAVLLLVAALGIGLIVIR